MASQQIIISIGDWGMEPHHALSKSKSYEPLDEWSYYTQQKGFCKCGAELKPKYTYCTDCARENERERKREYRQRKKEQQYQLELNSPGENTPKCRECGNKGKAGHTYCDVCAKRAKRKSNRERQRKWRKGNRLT